MDSRRVELSAKATDELTDAWEWTVNLWGLRQADRYIDFLLKEISDLEWSYFASSMVNEERSLRYRVAKLPGARNGHVIVFSLGSDSEVVEVLRVVPTNRNWR